MNDKEFREDCKVLANDIIDFHSGWKKSLSVPTDWVGIMEDTRQLDTAALLYIAANMPSPSNEEKKPEMEKEKCKYCSVPEIEVGENEEPFATRKDNNLSILFSAEDLEILVDNTETGEGSVVNINNCPFCRRKL